MYTTQGIYVCVPDSSEKDTNKKNNTMLKEYFDTNNVVNTLPNQFSAKYCALKCPTYSEQSLLEQSRCQSLCAPTQR
jgi:hypothetical protein